MKTDQPQAARDLPGWATTQATPGQPALLRVDVGGVPIFVRGQDAYEHLTHLNHRLAVAKLALHKIAAGREENSVSVAAAAIEEMRRV